VAVECARRKLPSLRNREKVLQRVAFQKIIHDAFDHGLLDKRARESLGKRGGKRSLQSAPQRTPRDGVLAPAGSARPGGDLELVAMVAQYGPEVAWLPPPGSTPVCLRGGRHHTLRSRPGANYIGPSMSDAPITREQVRELTAAWWLLLVMGLLSAVVGVIVLAKPSHSLATLAVITGLFVLIDSIFELVTSLFADRGGGGALLGVLGIVVGILLIRHPIHGVLAIALLIGIWLVAIGVIRLIRALALEHRLWNIVVALIEIVAGIVIVSSPHIGFATLALLVGISFILNGIAVVALGWTMHMLRRVAPTLVPDAGLNT
jgi:uncharacterized membrane protein HdeD (DUF308 family)